MRKLWIPVFLFSIFLIPILWSFEPTQEVEALLETPPDGDVVEANVVQPDDAVSELFDQYPKDYFMPPVAGPLHMTGTCGELRSNHFHAGTDLDGQVGNPVFAAADGFIDRIKVLQSGYGNVLYVKHPNGYTTVYAHLDRFSSEVQRYVKENQYRREHFQIELTPPDGKFKVKKGQEIAKLGNSGSSSGAHLHFEIRNAASKTLNPQLFGLPIVDNIPPDLRDMKVYFLNENRSVLGSKAFSLLKDKKASGSTSEDTVLVGGWRIGFGIKTYDQSTGFKNENGVFSIALWADDQLAYEWKAESFDFGETRYLNAHIDYSAKKRYGAWFNRCFVLPGNKLSNYTQTPSMGAITIYKEKPVKIGIKVTDAKGNSSLFVFWVKRDDSAMESFISEPYQIELPYDADSRYDVDGFSMVMPKGALYENLFFQYSTTPDESNGIYSSMHHVHDDKTPVQQYFDISIRPTNMPPELRSKAVIANCGDGKPDNCGGTWVGDVLKTRVRNFGDYCIMADTEAPSIKPVIFTTDMRKKKSMAFRISDNFAVSGTADGMKYRGTVDGKWVMFEYDSKRARLTYDFDEHVGVGEHVLKLSVVDDKGNERVFEGKFIR